MSISLENFRRVLEICYQYHSLHSYPLRFFMTMNDTSKVALVEPKVCEASVVRQEPYEEGEMDHCFVYDIAKNRG
jgi:hypothetical protein